MVRFVLDGEVIEVADADPTRTVLQFLREDLCRIGTKEGCAEGDCGACTVALVEIAPDGERLQVRALNSCIQFLPTLDGKELITVESLRGADGTLHPVQQAMVDCHGSQCGFCTPGFVMSMFALYKNNACPGRREIDDALAGNLCRCTGYSPIVKAAGEMYRLGSARAKGESWLLAPHGSQAAVDADEKGRVAMLRSIRRAGTLRVAAEGRQFQAPETLDELARLAEEEPDATLLAGGTDVGLWVTKQLQELQTVIYTGRVEELKRLTVTKTHIDIGAAVSLTDAMPVLVAHYPEVEQVLLRFASPPIRNAGTLGGNVANGSPIGDTMPALLALDATLVLRKGRDTRELPLTKFYLDYRKTALARGELLERVLIPLPQPGAHLRTYKVSKRFDQDISAVCGAYWLKLDDATIAGIRIAYGGLAAVPKRAMHCEQALLGSAWNEAAVQDAMSALDADFKPIADMRSSAAYRRRICRNLLHRFYLELSGAVETTVYDYGRQKLA
ncbi:MAG: xanthine dehydrogenase small subunit [Woeseiaceae bacterium]